jgi:hypothetical protein
MRSTKSGTASTCLAVVAKVCIAPGSLCLSREVRLTTGRGPTWRRFSSLVRPARAGTRRAHRAFLRTTIAVTSHCLTGATSAGANRLRLIPVEPGFFRIADGAHPEAFPLATVWSVCGESSARRTSSVCPPLRCGEWGLPPIFHTCTGASHEQVRSGQDGQSRFVPLQRS